MVTDALKVGISSTHSIITLLEQDFTWDNADSRSRHTVLLCTTTASSKTITCEPPFLAHVLTGNEYQYTMLPAQILVTGNTHDSGSCSTVGSNDAETAVPQLLYATLDLLLTVQGDKLWLRPVRIITEALCCHNFTEEVSTEV